MSIQIHEAQMGRYSADLIGRDLIHTRVPFAMSPFLVVSDFRMTGPVFPPHPHAGFSVATYILPESETGFWNQDTLGNLNRIAPGALHWTVAGSGLMHEETVMRRGRAALGLQIWIDHPEALREMPPAALHLTAAEVPVAEAGGVTRRQVLGQNGGMASPLQTPVEVALADVEAAPGARWTESMRPGHQGWILVHAGAVIIDGHKLPEGHATPLVGATDITATAMGSRVFVFSGLPMNGRPAQRGPFVGHDRAMLDRFDARFQGGGMGRLAPFDQDMLDAVDGTDPMPLRPKIS